MSYALSKLMFFFQGQKAKNEQESEEMEELSKKSQFCSTEVSFDTLYLVVFNAYN